MQTLFDLATASADHWLVAEEERLVRVGPSAVDSPELLALLVGANERQADAVKRLVRRLGLNRIQRMSVAELAALDGFSVAMSRKILAALDLANRLYLQNNPPPQVVREPQDIAKLLEGACAGLAVEKLWVASLNTRYRLLSLDEVSSGTATSSLAHPREAFRKAITHGATSIVIAHNHPTGNPEPSASDRQITRQLREASRVVGIDLMDHVIIGTPSCDPVGRGWFSFRQAGLL